MSDEPGPAPPTPDSPQVPEEEYEYDDEADAGPQVLHSVLSDFLQYQHEDGTTLSLADILLLIKQSIDRNTEMQSRVLEACLTGACKNRK